jgi:tRNA (cmo5U34)-methyltransferase
VERADDASQTKWSEQNSRAFLDWGRYCVPDREYQIELICDLIPPHPEPFHILELCCGEGLLAEALLTQFPNCIFHGLDGSEEMLKRAQARLANYAPRVTLGRFDLSATDWRTLPWLAHAVVSALAIHHLDQTEKRQLFSDVHRMLASDGVFVIADLVQPIDPHGLTILAQEWDRAVRQRSLLLDGNDLAYQHFSQSHENIYLYPDPMDKPSPLLAQLEWMQQAGLTQVDVYWARAGHAIFAGRAQRA